MYWGNDFWTTKGLVLLSQAKDLETMQLICLDLLEEMPDPIEKLCGPMTSGGQGREQNMAQFAQMVKKLTSEGRKIFDQIPFQLKLEQYAQTTDTDYFQVLTEFYQPIFATGKISKMPFLPNWQSSRGSTWAHQEANKLGIKIEYLKL